MQKLQLIQAGVGGFGGGWVRNHTSQSPDFELAAIVDVNEAMLQAVGDELSIPPERRFTRLEGALSDIPADAVLSVTPPAVHLAHARATFEAGMHFMCEKPVAASLEDAMKMVQLANEYNRQLVVSQNYRYQPMMRTLQKLVRQDKPVGAFGHVHIDFYIAADFTGTFRQSMAHVLLVDMCVHHFDALRSVTGRNITRIYAQTFKPAWSWYEHNPALKVVGELEGGVPFSYSGDWSGRGRQTNWPGTWRIQCADGSLHYDTSHAGEAITLARSGRGFPAKDVAEETVPVIEVAFPGQAGTLAAFAEAIRTGKEAETSGRDNLHTFAAVQAAVQSAQTGLPVDVMALLNA